MGKKFNFCQKLNFYRLTEDVEKRLLFSWLIVIVGFVGRENKSLAAAIRANSIKNKNYIS
jgi:hypothetical protein